MNLILTCVTFIPLILIVFFRTKIGVLIAFLAILVFHRKLFPFLPSYFHPRILIILAVFVGFCYSKYKEIRRNSIEQITLELKSNIKLWDIFILLIFLVMSLALLFSEYNTLELLKNFLYCGACFTIFLLFRYAPKNKEVYHFLALAFPICILVLTSYSLYPLIFKSQSTRLDSLVGKNFSAFLLCVSFPYLISFFSFFIDKQIGINRSLLRFSLHIILPIYTIVLIGYGSRAGILIFAIVLIMTAATLKVLIKPILTSFVLLVLAFCFIMPYSQNFSYVSEKYITMSLYLANFESPNDKSTHERKYVIDLYSESEIKSIGLGPGQFRRKTDPLAVENTYIQSLMDLGWIGFSLLLLNGIVIFHLLLKELFKAINSNNYKSYYFTLSSLIALIAFLICCFFNDLLYQYYSWAFFGILHGYLYHSSKTSIHT